MDIQYAQAAVYTRLILHSQAMESKQKQLKHKMTLIVDVDINLLKNCTNTAASTP
jgi:hypothetical protein